MSLYVKRAGKIFGPFTREDVSNCLSQGLFTPENHISEDRMEWIALSEYQKRLKASEAASHNAAADIPLKPQGAVPVLKPAGQQSPSPLKRKSPPGVQPPVLRPPAGAAQPVLRPVGGAPGMAAQPIPQPAGMAAQPLTPSGTGNASPTCAIVSIVASVVCIIATTIAGAVNDPMNPATQVLGWIMLITSVIAVVCSALGIKKSGPGGWRVASIVNLVLSGLFLLFEIVIVIVTFANISDEF